MMFLKTTLPLKNLFKLSCCFSGTVSFFLLLSATMEGEKFQGAVTRSISAFLLIILLSICNIGLFLLLKKKDPLEGKKYTVRFYISSFVMSAIMISCTYLAHRYLEHLGWMSIGLPSRVKGPIIYLYMPIQGILINGIVLLLQNFIIVQDANNKAQVENFRLNTARSEAAYQLLLQQIHPHFLFNALNILKSLIKKSPERAENYLLLLSDFLRVSISGHKSGVATLQEEVKLCVDYLEMQKVRFGEALVFSFEIQSFDNIFANPAASSLIFSATTSAQKIKENNTGTVLPVFSLQPLLENAIKHNELTEAAPLVIRVRQEGGWISVMNNIQLRSVREDSTGSGLANLAERYKLLSGDEIDIVNDGSTFCVSLKILNDEHRNHRR